MEPPYSNQYQDVYFSRLDGLAEKRHVFLGGNDLPARFIGRDDFVVFEAGFGTGLSFLAAAQMFLETTMAHQHLHFISVEAHPLSVGEIIAALKMWPELRDLVPDLTAQLDPLVPGWHRIVLRGRVHLTLIVDDLNQALPELDTSVDAWFLDGFAPAKNPAMWSDTLFDAMRRLSATHATAATYSAARVVKDGLSRAGFDVQKTAGFGHKGDMVTARLRASGRLQVQGKRNQSVQVQGGGLAGCAAAYAFKQAGQNVTLVAPRGIADAASGNPRGLYNPRFAKTFSPVAQFYAGAFAHFHRLARQHGAHFDWMQNGALHLLHNDTAAEKLQALQTAWGWGDEGARMVDAAAASDIAGLPLSHPALWLPQSGSVDPRALCAFYARDLAMVPKAEAGEITVLAMGADVAAHPALAALPWQKIRGQISFVRANDVSAPLKTNLCYGGYLAPAQNGTHVLGATFQHWLEDPQLRADDHIDLQEKLHAVTGPMFTPGDVIGGRVGFRATLADRVPVIGRILDQIYVSGAHGSHGILSSWAGGQYLADVIAGVPVAVPLSAQKCLKFERFFTPR